MLNNRKIAIVLAHAFVGWVLCDATVGIGRTLMSMGTTLIVHAILAPIFFMIVSLFYFRKFNYTTPLQTALIFVGFVMVVDFLFVALVINKSLDMFASLIGTWIPFALIFTSTYLTGSYTVRILKQKPAAL